MRITRLELDGFKSFGRPTLFDFEAPMTGIVGPNGCGKSNVVDAVRWVLGEASRKALRAKESTDVVFSGSASRKAARQAEVSITFDNSDGSMGVAHKSVKVTRRLSAGGDSEYFINGEEAKLKDIKGVLQGTGAGMSAYCIMEQGKMDALLQANPLERRRVFEEAAGIGNLRKQQEDAQSKLTVVDQNLGALKNILDEVRGQLRKIKGQATRALRYTELRERQRLLQMKLALRDFHGFDKAREALLSRISDAGAREGAIQAEMAKTRMDLEDAEAKLNHSENEFRRISESVHKLELRITSEASRRDNALSRVESLKQAIARVREQAERVRENTASLKVRRQNLAQKAETTKAELGEMAQRLAALSEAEHAVAKAAETLEGDLKATRAKLLDAIGTANQSLNERMRLDAEMRTARRRLESLSARAGEVERELGEIETRRGAAQGERDTEEARLAGLKAEMAQVEAEASPLALRVNELRQRKHGLELKQGQKSERKGVLEGMAQQRVGLDETAVKLLSDETRARSFGILGVFADAVRVDLAFAAGLERVLGDLGSAIIVDSREHAHDLFDWLAGRGSVNISLVARDEFKAGKVPAFPSGHGVIGPMIEQVKVKAGFEALAQSLLGDVLLVADRSVARRLMERGARNYRIVTPTGELFSPPGAFALAFGEGRSGIITRQSEIDRLQREIGELGAEIEASAQELGAALNLQAQLQARAGELRNAIYDASMEAAGKRVALDSLKREAARLGEEQGLLSREQQQLKAAMEADLGRHGKLSEAIALAEEAKQSCEQRLASLNEESTLRREQLAEARQKLTEAKVAEATCRTECRQAEEALKGIDDALARYADEIARGAGEAEAHAKQIRELEHEARASVEVQAELEREARELRERRLSGDGSLTLLRNGVEQARQSLATLQETLYRERESVQQARIDENTLFMKMDQVRRRMAELHNADIDTLYREYDPQADTVNEEAAQAELDALNEQLAKLGNVNMEAMDELREVEDRNNFYSRQEQDLIKAKRTLSDAIARIERESRRLFVTTFEAIRTNFQRIFRRLFGGGSADIILQNPEDPLNSGVDIIAKPPGKEALSISMRSGGERALISVAMMFSIYEINPAPFAILDEVDAPLDEANVDRFCDIVREYARLSQFIVITHHKKTMTACDMLYGVTMQEPGVSTKVSVDLRASEQPELAAAGA